LFVFGRQGVEHGEIGAAEPMLRRLMDTIGAAIIAYFA
jgi:hypothetical protein